MANNAFVLRNGIADFARTKIPPNAIIIRVRPSKLVIDVIDKTFQIKYKETPAINNLNAFRKDSLL